MARFPTCTGCWRSEPCGSAALLHCAWASVYVAAVERIFESVFHHAASVPSSLQTHSSRVFVFGRSSWCETLPDRRWKAPPVCHAETILASGCCSIVRLAAPIARQRARPHIALRANLQGNAPLRQQSPSNSGSWIAAMPCPMRSTPSNSIASRISFGAANFAGMHQAVKPDRTSSLIHLAKFHSWHAQFISANSKRHNRFAMRIFPRPPQLS